MEYIEFWPRLPFARQSGVKFWTQVTRKDTKNNSIDSYVSYHYLQGSSEYFHVLCNSYGNYNVPKRLRDWPICLARTTTVSPVIPIALKNMMQAFTSRLEFRLETYAWTGDGPKIKPRVDNHMLKICIPVVIGMY